jgi:hypothetical protein
MRLFSPTHIKPVYPLLAALVLLAISLLFFFWSKPVSLEQRHTETSEDGAGSYHSPLLCI